jgi:hypothetical protein
VCVNERMAVVDALGRVNQIFIRLGPDGAWCRRENGGIPFKEMRVVATQQQTTVGPILRPVWHKYTLFLYGGVRVKTVIES